MDRSLGWYMKYYANIVVVLIPGGGCVLQYFGYLRMCDLGETGRALQERIMEHQHDVRLNTKKEFPRSQRKQSEGEHSNSALMDHCNKANHVINWGKVKILRREGDNATQEIREAIAIKQRPNNLQVN